MGYYFHKPQGSDPTYDWQMYNDLYFGVKIECAYYLSYTLSLRLTPEYDIFFEQHGNLGGIFSIEVCFAYSYTFSKGSEQNIGKGITKIEERNKIILSTAGLIFAPYKEFLIENNEQDKKTTGFCLTDWPKRSINIRVTGLRSRDMP
jgi:hypothetical protein